MTFGSDQCVLRGASVQINCEYDYPFGHIVTTVGWAKSQQRFGNLQLVPLPDPSKHYQYVGNFRGDCRLQINDVQYADAGNYFFSFRTTFGEWTSETSAQLSVKGNCWKKKQKTVNKCLNHSSNFTLLPVIQSWRLLSGRAPWRRATSSVWPACRAVPPRWTSSGSGMERLW